ncbi:MAG: N-glycosylase/DNA lyase [Nanoarchaeota archaeon]
MNQLINKIENLKKSEIKKIIDFRMNEFSKLGKSSSNEIFKELCFCLLTANFSAQGGIKIQNAVNDGFLTLSEEDLAKKLSALGHRFPNTRAKYIFEAREYKNNIKEILRNFKNESEARNWIVKNIKGLGMKESSHFLRNIGYKNLAIIDFHIIDLLARNNLIDPEGIPSGKKPKSKSLAPKKYIEIENLLRKIAEKTNLSLGELDLYLWYAETGKVLK